MKKKFNKVVSLALASVMTLGLFTTVNLGSTTAKADDPNSTTTQTTVDQTASANKIDTLTVYKDVKVETEGALLPTMTFEVTMKPATVSSNTKDDINGGGTNVVYSGIELADDTVEFNFDSSDNTSTMTVEKAANFDMKFKGSFTHTGVYRYTMKESLPDTLYDKNGNQLTDANGDLVYSNGYITYDSTEYTVDLYVFQEDNGDYYVKNAIIYDAAVTTKPQKLLFKNEIDCATLTIAKNVDGTEFQTGQDYEFRILIPKDGSTIILEPNQVFKGNIYDGTTLVDTIDIKVAGQNINDTNYATNWTTFYLKKGQKLEIVGLPVSMIYKVEEVTDDIYKEDYEPVKYSYKEYGTFASPDGTQNTYLTDQVGSSVQGTINTDTNSIIFTNTRNVTVGTGLSIDFLPYALVLLVAVCGSILFIITKKRKQ